MATAEFSAIAPIPLADLIEAIRGHDRGPRSMDNVSRSTWVGSEQGMAKIKFGMVSMGATVDRSGG